MPRRRNSRSRRRQRRSVYRQYTLTIPHPERRNAELRIRIPSPRRCLSPYRRTTNYCGSKRRLPSGYTRYGTRYECLKKGIGAGICSVYR